LEREQTVPASLSTDIQALTNTKYSGQKPRTWKLTVITRAEATVTAKDW
jgi:hypothetical protein